MVKLDGGVVMPFAQFYQHPKMAQPVAVGVAV
jgi:hypothetical protein